MTNYQAMRERAGYSVAEVAAAIKTSASTLQSWEQGKTSPRALHIVKLCKLYGCSADQLIGLQPVR